MATQKLQPADFAHKPELQDPPGARGRRMRHLIYIFLLFGIAILLFAWPPVASA